MLVLGLSGPAGSGKSAVAEYLVKRYGFLRFSFSDALYREVAAAFSLPDESLLRDRTTKEVPTERLALVDCLDDEFIGVAVQHIHGSRHPDNEPLSPRQVLQWYGSEYRRVQDPDYWVKRAQDWIHAAHYFHPYPELRSQYFVNDSVRFQNEREWVHLFEDSNIWHLHRDTVAPVHAHQSETPLPVLDGEREIWNNAGLQHLYQAVDLLLSTAAPTVRCEPMEKITEPEEQS